MGVGWGPKNIVTEREEGDLKYNSQLREKKGTREIWVIRKRAKTMNEKTTLFDRGRNLEAFVLFYWKI